MRWPYFCSISKRLAPCGLGQSDRAFRRLGDVAAAEHVRVGKAVHKIDDQQRRGVADADGIAEALRLIDLVFAVHYSAASLTAASGMS